MITYTYRTNLVWQGSTGAGYRHYARRHTAVAPPAAEMELSADPHFRGDPGLTNPEQLVVMAASSCQLLSFLAVAAQAGIDVVGYTDSAEGVLSNKHPRRLERIALAPVIRVIPGTDHERVRALIDKAHDGCFITNSLTGTVTITATVLDA
ncbi:MAG TPA: OsmC family protein [Actinoplanes sp.]